MSDLSVLTQQYENVAQLSRKLNDAVVATKMVRERLPGVEGIQPDEINACQRQLSGIVADLLASLDGALLPPRPSARPTIPRSFLARLRRDHSTDLEYFRDDLARVGQRLVRGLCALDDGDVLMLDQLAAAADAETSQVFRRLTRA